MPPDSAVSHDAFDTEGSEFLCWYYRDGDVVRKMNGYMEKCGYKIFER